MMNEYDIALGLQDLKTDPRFDMATLNYILTGDRSGYDVIAQTAMQKKQMENAQELARAQKLAEDEYRKAEDEKNLRLADADFFAAQQALLKNPNDYVLQANFNRAEANRKLAEQRVGRQIPEAPQPAEVAEPAAPVMTNQELTANIEEILKGEHTNESAAKIKELIGQLGDPALQDQYNQKLINRGKTKEQKAADAEARKIQAAKELKEANTVYKNTGKYDITKYDLKFKDKVPYLVRKEKK